MDRVVILIYDDLIIDLECAAEIFREMDDALSNQLEEKKKRESYGGKLSGIQQSWLEVIDSEDDFTEIINANIATFKLPKKLY